LEAYGRDVLPLPWVPTIVVLDGKSALHIFEVGYNHLLVQKLLPILTRPAASDDLAAEILAQFQQR